MVPCSVLLGTMNMYLVACGTFPQTLILANKTIATALSTPTIERNNFFSPSTTQSPMPNYVTTTTRTPSIQEAIVVSTTSYPSTNVPTTTMKFQSYTTTLHPNLRGPSTTSYVKNKEMNSELTTTSRLDLESLQQNSSVNIYTVTKIIKEIQLQQDLTPVWVCVGFLIMMGIYIIKTIQCPKKSLQRKDSVLPSEEDNGRKNRNSWSTGPTPKQKSFLREMAPPIPKRPAPSAPPPPPTEAKMQIAELTKDGALDRLKEIRSKRKNNRLRTQVMKLSQQQQSINVNNKS